MYVCILLQLTSAQLSSAQPSPAQPSQASNPQLQPTPASSCSVSLAYRASSVCVCGETLGIIRRLQLLSASYFFLYVSDR